MSEPIYFADAGAFRDWLAAHADGASELLVGYHKVGSGRPSMTWPESVDEALCVGWIDGRRNRIDDASYAIRFTPRKPASIWSAINIAKVAQLIEQGRMRPAGARAFALRAESKSRVYAYERATDAALAHAELEAFKQDPAAWRFFDHTPPGYKRRVMHWVVSAKRDATRAARLAALMRACADGVRLD